MNERSRASTWMLARITRLAPLSPRRTMALVCAIVVTIAVADYLSEINVALTVFYFVPILMAVAWLGTRTAVGVAVASILLKIGGDCFEVAGALPLWSWWNAASTLLVLLLIIWVFGSLLALYRQMEQRVAERTAALMRASDERRRLEHELMTASSNERSRMGQELHDDICQHLVGTALAAQTLSQRLARHDNPLARDAQAIGALLEQGISKTRQLARGLLLSEIEPDKLPERLSELADDACGGGVACRFEQAGAVRVADATVAAQVYRIAQEAIRNAIRHADAASVDIALVGDGRSIRLTVDDDGRGLPPEPGREAGMGLAIMSQRAAWIGAELLLAARPGRGTRLTCTLGR